MKCRRPFLMGLLPVFLLLLAGPSSSQQAETAALGGQPEKLALFQATMCEALYNRAPRNATVVFSVAREKAICFTAFDPVPHQTVIYHNWYSRDVPSARIRLTLKPPRWSTYSSIQLRETDIGPWRVEITDEAGKILATLRFSVTE